MLSAAESQVPTEELKQGYPWLKILLEDKPFQRIVSEELARRWHLELLWQASVEYIFLYSPLSALLNVATQDPTTLHRAGQALADNFGHPLVRGLVSMYDSRADILVTSVELGMAAAGHHQTTTTPNHTTIDSKNAAQSSPLNTLVDHIVDASKRPVPNAYLSLANTFNEYARALSPHTKLPLHREEGHSRGESAGGGSGASQATGFTNRYTRLQEKYKTVTHKSKLFSFSALKEQPLLQAFGFGTSREREDGVTEQRFATPRMTRHEDTFVKECRELEHELRFRMKEYKVTHEGTWAHKLIQYQKRTERETKRKYIRDILGNVGQFQNRLSRIGYQFLEMDTTSSENKTKQPNQGAPPPPPKRTTTNKGVIAPPIEVQYTDEELDTYFRVDSLRKAAFSYSDMRKRESSFRRLDHLIQTAGLLQENTPPELLQAAKSTVQIGQSILLHNTSKSDVEGDALPAVDHQNKLRRMGGHVSDSHVPT